MFSVKDFGAAGDGKTNDTKAIQAAIDKAAAAGGGRVTVEKGVYLSSTIYLRGNIEFHLMAGAKILGSTDPADYDDFKSPGFRHELSPENNCKCLIAASGVSSVSITGQGEINGSGPAFYDTAGAETKRFYAKPPRARPRILMMHNCRNVKIEDVSLVDSPCWTAWLIECENVNIHRVKVIGDQKMINNDGIDIDACRNVSVSDSFFKTGDDCLILRSIQGQLERPAVCENVTVTNCVMDSACQCVRVGCPSDSVIRDCVFSNLVMKGHNGINIDNPARYLMKGDSGSMDLRNILFSNVTANCSGTPVRVCVDEGVKLAGISGLTFSNFRIKSALPIIVTGNKDTIIRDVTFSNIKAETSGADAIVCRHCAGVKMSNVELSNQEPSK
jgi:polygalacturonase